MLIRMKQTAGQLGLPLNDPSMVYNTRLAQELGKWAETRGKGDDYHHTLFSAYFADGENIGEISVLKKLAKSIGLSPETAQDILESRTFKQEVADDWDLAREKEVSAVPTFYMADQRIVGAQSYDVLKAFVSKHANKT